MKTKRIFLGLTLLCVLALLFNTNTAAAQDDGPSPGIEEKMPDQFEPADLVSKGSINNLLLGGNLSLTPVTDIINIAAEGNIDEVSPKVAYGYTEYGVAYQKNGDIYVTFVRYDGTIMSTYQLSSGTGKSGCPDIAFEGSSGLFVVAWEYYYTNTDWDVRCRAVDPFTGTRGNICNLAREDDYEYQPSLDCNHIDGSCLVAFTYYDEPWTYIKGRFMDVDSSGVHIPAHDAFYATPTSAKSPDYLTGPLVAWGWNTGAYLVVMYYHDDSGHDYGIYTHVYDSYQSSGAQSMYPSSYKLVDPGISWLAYDKVPTDVTYDPCTRKFLVLFTHDFEGLGIDYDLFLQIVDDVSSFERIGEPIPIAGTEGSENWGSISFLTNAWAAQFDMGPDQAVIAYNKLGGNPKGIMTTVIQGNNSTSNPEYTSQDYSDHVLVKAPHDSVNSFVDDPTIAGSGSSGNFLVGFSDYNFSVNEQDILGKIFLVEEAEAQIFLPIIIR